MLEEMKSSTALEVEGETIERNGRKFNKFVFLAFVKRSASHFKTSDSRVNNTEEGRRRNSTY